MATCSTSSPPTSNPLPELLSKMRPFELSCQHETCFSDGVLDTEYNNCVSSELESLAAIDKKLCELRPILEAQKRIKSTMKQFLEEEADKVKKSLKGYEDGKSEEQEHSEDGVSENVVFVPLAWLDKAALAKLEVRSFLFKIWLRQIQLTRQEDQEKYNSLQDFEHAIHNAQEAIREFKDLMYKCYNKEDLRETIPYYEVHLKEAISKALEEKEKAGFEMTEDDVVIFCSNRARICALLGLQLDFLDHLEEIPTEDCDPSYTL